MTPDAVLAALVALAEETGLAVRAADPAGGEGPLGSALCRVRGELWVVLVPADPVEHRIRVLAAALRKHAGAALEQRWLAPALRDWIDRA